MGKKRKHRRAYLDDFRVSAAGEYIYTGPVWQCAADVPARRRAMAGCWAGASCMLLAAVAGGCISAPGMTGSALTLLPYLAQLFAAVSVVWALVRVTEGKGTLRDYVYTRTVPHLPGRCLAVTICAAAAFAAECLYMLLRGAGGKTAAAVLYLLTAALCAAGSLVTRGFFRTISWETGENLHNT